MVDSRTEYTATSRRTRCLCTFKWTISDFDTVCPKDDAEIGRITSPAFTAGNEVGKKSEWCLSVAGKNGNAELFLFRLAAESLEDEINLNTVVLVKYKISLGNSKNPYLLTENGEHRFDDEDEEWGTRILKVSGLYSHNQILLEGNKLRLELEMEIEGAMACNISAKSSLKRKRPLEIETLSAHLQNLFESKEHSDILIRCGGSSFHCHKLLLAGRSPVFNSLLTTPPSGTESKELEIKSMDPVILSTILHYIYTGRVELPPFFCWTDLIRGADEYGLSALKNYCFGRLVENLSEENLGKITVAADKYKADEETREILQKFFKTNMKTLMENTGIRELLFDHSHLFFEEFAKNDKPVDTPPSNQK